MIIMDEEEEIKQIRDEIEEPIKPEPRFIPGPGPPKPPFKIWKLIKKILLILLPFICIILLLSILTAYNNLDRSKNIEIEEANDRFNNCETEKNNFLTQKQSLQTQLDNTDSCPSCPEVVVEKCTIQDAFINRTNDIIFQESSNSSYIRSLIREINHLKNMTDLCFGMNETMNSTVKEELRQCRLKLDRIEDITEEN